MKEVQSETNVVLTSSPSTPSRASDWVNDFNDIRMHTFKSIKVLV